MKIKSYYPTTQQASRMACKLGLLAGIFLPAIFAQAQVTVTGVTYGTLVNSSNTTRGGLTYDNRYAPVTSVATSTEGDYQFSGPVATSVIARRNTDSNGNGTPNQSSDNPNNTTIIYQASGSTNLGTYNSNLSSLFLSNNLYEGLSDPFGNGAGTATNSNIERLDFYLPNYTVQEGAALVFFDVESAGTYGDAFRIAAFTAVDGAGDLDPSTVGTPTTYANTGLLVAADSFGGPVNNPSGTASASYKSSTFTNGDSLSGTATGTTSNGTQSLVGIMIRFSDLNISAGTVIQGFSLMAADTAPATAANLVNWNNATYYPTNTSTPNDKIDFMAFGATVARPVPEPSTYGALFIGLTASFFGWRRYRRGLSAAAA